MSYATPYNLMTKIKDHNTSYFSSRIRRKRRSCVHYLVLESSPHAARSRVVIIDYSGRGAWRGGGGGVAALTWWRGGHLNTA